MQEEDDIILLSVMYQITIDAVGLYVFPEIYCVGPYAPLFNTV